MMSVHILLKCNHDGRFYDFNHDFDAIKNIKPSKPFNNYSIVIHVLIQ